MESFDRATGINDHPLVDQKDGNELIYDLQGRVVSKPSQKGVYIKNHKKFLGGRR